MNYYYFPCIVRVFKIKCNRMLIIFFFFLFGMHYIHYINWKLVRLCACSLLSYIFFFPYLFHTENFKKACVSYFSSYVISIHSYMSKIWVKCSYFLCERIRKICLTIFFVSFQNFRDCFLEMVEKKRKFLELVCYFSIIHFS